MMIGESLPFPAPQPCNSQNLVLCFLSHLGCCFFVAIVFPRQPCSRTQVQTVHACLVDGFLESMFHDLAQLNETKVGASNGLHLTKLSNLASRRSLTITYSRVTCPARREHNSLEMFYLRIDHKAVLCCMLLISFDAAT